MVEVQETKQNRQTTDGGLTPPRDTAYLGRLESNLAIAEQTARVVAEMDAAPAIERVKRTSLAVTVVIPVYNERDTIVEIVRRVQAVGIHEEILIVDDFSTDGTRQLLLELSREPDIRVLMHGYNRGKGAALRTAFEQARGEVIVIQDADLEYNPNDLLRLLEPMERGEADVVYGSRFLENAQQDPSRLHRWGNWLLTAASNLTTGQRLTDMETCYKAFRREVLAEIDVEQNRFGFEPEITAKVSRLGYRIVELPIRYECRGYDEGKKIGLRDAANALWCIAKYGCC
jgi:glycosyltransferase involved in cell wall biosynthesis